MKFDYFTIYVLTGGLEFIIALILAYYLYIVRPNRWIIFYFLLYKLFDSLALIGFGLQGTPYNFISLRSSSFILHISWIFLAISVVSHEGKIPRRFSLSLAIPTIVISMLSWLNNDCGKPMIYFTTFLSVLIFVPVAIRLLYTRESLKIPFLLAACFLLFALINTIRALLIYQSGNNYAFTDFIVIDTIFLIISLGLIIVSTVGFFLLLSEIDKKTIFEQSRLNQIAFEQSPLSIVITDLNGKIRYVNPEFCKITGYSDREVIGRNPKILSSGFTPPEIHQSMWKTIRSGNTWFGEFINQKKDGEIYYEEAAIAPLKDEKGVINSFFALKTDVTFRKRAEELILNQNKELKELDHTKNKLFSIISHDLRSPIGNMMTILELIDDLKNEGEQEKAFELLDLAKANSKVSFDLLENLLHWSRSQLNAFSKKESQFAIHTVVDEVVSLYRMIVEQKEVSISENIDKSVMVLADKEMISTVVRNLISNAIKFVPQKGHILIETRKIDQEVIVSVIDNGVGIEENRLAKLFSFNDNQSTTGTAGEKGTGLGMVLCHDFIQRNNGKLWIESTVGKGTSVHFSLHLVLENFEENIKNNVDQKS